MVRGGYQPAATTVRMNSIIHTLAVGAFGEAVISQLTFSDRVSGPLWPPELWPAARVRVLASWYPVPGLMSALDEATFQTGIPWLPVIQEHPLVRIGPAVIPGLGPCYSCARQRFLQHDDDAQMSKALLSFYEGHPGAGPVGYLP